MADDADRPEPVPTCVQEVGSKRASRLCGDPARYSLAPPGSDRVVAMCEFHGWWAMDRAGYQIVTEWPAAPGQEGDRG